MSAQERSEEERERLLKQGEPALQYFEAQAAKRAGRAPAKPREREVKQQGELGWREKPRPHD